MKAALLSTVPGWVLLHWVHRMSIPFHPKPKRRNRPSNKRKEMMK